MCKQSFDSYIVAALYKKENWADSLLAQTSLMITYEVVIYYFAPGK